LRPVKGDFMRILFVGDSQNAALKRACDAEGSQAILARGLQVDFISAIGPVAQLMTSDSSRIWLDDKPKAWPKHVIGPEQLDRLHDETRRQFEALGKSPRVLGGFRKKTVDLLDYDAVVSVGGWIVRLWLNLDNAIADAGVSRAFVQDFADEMFSRSNACRWLGKALGNKGFENKFFFMPDPIANELSPDVAKYSTSRQPDFRLTFDALRRVAEGMGVILLPYPDGFLNATASAISKEFKAERPGDFMHLNLRGNAILLKHILEHVERGAGTSRKRNSFQANG